MRTPWPSGGGVGRALEQVWELVSMSSISVSVLVEKYWKLPTLSSVPAGMAAGLMVTVGGAPVGPGPDMCEAGRDGI